MTGAAQPRPDSLRVYLSGVTSITHAVYAASYLRDVLAHVDGPVTLVDLGLRTFLGRSNVTREDLAQHLPDDPRLVIESATWAATPTKPGEGLVYLSVGAPGIKPYLRLRRLHGVETLHVVVVDEGLGSYGTWQTRRSSSRREGGREPWTTTRALAVTAARRVLTSERWALYLRRDGGWVVNEAVAREFRRETGVVRGRSANRTVVFLSQPWVELGLLSEERYLDHLGQIAAACRRAGLELAVRPHPGENAERFAEFRVVSRRTPAELDADVVAARAVIGVSSTAMLNMAAVHGRPALRVAIPELAHLDAELSSNQRSLLDQWLTPALPPESILEGLPGR